MTIVIFRSIFFYNYVCWNIQKKLWYMISNVCFIFMRLGLTLTVLILILHFGNFHWDSATNKILTREIKVVGWPCDLILILFFKIKLNFFSNYFTDFLQTIEIVRNRKLSKCRKQKIFFSEVSDSCILYTVRSTRNNFQAKKHVTGNCF